MTNRTKRLRKTLIGNVVAWALLGFTAQIFVAAARSANTGMEWNEARNSISDHWGGPPLVIEPVEGEIVLRREQGAAPLRLMPLDGRGLPKNQGIPITAKKGMTFTFSLLERDATIWYALTP